jgi:hypothetical protein
LGTRLESKSGLESKSSDLDVFEPGESATAPFPNLKIWTPAPFPNLKIWTPADTFVVPENLCFSTYLLRDKLPMRELENLITSLHDSIDFNQWNGCENITRGASSCVECCREQYFSGNQIDYSCDQKRKIYVLRYLPVHVREVYLAAKEIPSDKLKTILSKDIIRILSVGGGPGSDIAALKKVIMDFRERNQAAHNHLTIHIVRLDKETGWDNLSGQMIHTFSSNQCQFKYNKCHVDIVSSEITLEHCFDIVSISYLISELPDKDMPIFIRNVQKSLMRGSILLINDCKRNDVKLKIRRLLKALEYKTSVISDAVRWCGFNFPYHILMNVKPKLKTKSVRYMVLISDKPPLGILAKIKRVLSNILNRFIPF